MIYSALFASQAPVLQAFADELRNNATEIDGVKDAVKNGVNDVKKVIQPQPVENYSKGPSQTSTPMPIPTLSGSSASFFKLVTLVGLYIVGLIGSNLTCFTTFVYYKRHKPNPPTDPGGQA